MDGERSTKYRSRIKPRGGCQSAAFEKYAETTEIGVDYTVLELTELNSYINYAD